MTSSQKSDESKSDVIEKEMTNGKLMDQESSYKQTKSPPINSDLVSFPPLLNAKPHQTQHHLQHQQQAQQPVNTNINNKSSNLGNAINDSSEDTVQFDPAIISISNSANSIPTTPTIVTSNPSITNSSGQNKSAKKQHQSNLNKILPSSAVNESKGKFM